MKLLKKMLAILILLVLAGAGCVVYAFKIEPYRVRLHEITWSKEPKENASLTIAQISDLHIKEDYTSENLRKIVDKVNQQDPDIVLFTGDLYDNYAKYHEDENLISVLKTIRARYEKIAVWGNRDYGGGAVRQYAAIMEKAGFRLLKNENCYVTLEDGKRILLTGLDDSLFGEPRIPEDAESKNADYRILLTHEPDTIEDFMEDGYDFAAGGHSHGGQVNLPFLPWINEKALSATQLSTKYNRGLYTVGDHHPMKFYVNTGLGTTHISARFGVVPEIALFYISIV